MGFPNPSALRRLRARPHPAAVGALAAVLAAAPATARAVDLVLSEMTYVGSEAGHPAMVLVADRARIEHGGHLAHLEGVRLDAVGEDGADSLELTCDRALLNLETSDFTASGNVRGRTADGHRFETEQAEFDHAERIIESHAYVDIVDPAGTRLQGRGFHYDVRRQRMRMRDATVSETGAPAR